MGAEAEPNLCLDFFYGAKFVEQSMENSKDINQFHA